MATPERGNWAVTGPEARFGWMLPIIRPEDAEGPRVLVAYSPEIIAEQTADLDEQRLDTYLTGIEFLIMTHVGFIGQHEPDTARRMAEDALYDINPAALALMTDTQMKALSA